MLALDSAGAVFNLELETAKKNTEAVIAGLADSPQKKKLQRDWRFVQIVNIPEGNPVYMNSPSSGGLPVTINRFTWPDGPTVGRSLTAYHKALKEARHEHHRLVLKDIPVEPPVP